MVTGGAYYIGSHMARHLADRGEPAAMLDDLRTGFRESLPADMPFYQSERIPTQL